jgi:tRNA (adenine57-N1/adenine58-N1)-methyltransferase
MGRRPAGSPEPLGDGEIVILIDQKNRRYLVTLNQKTGSFSTHHGTMPHTEIVGKAEGSILEVGPSRFVVLRPRLSDYILKMKRGAQIVYPKDMGPILMYGDISSGQTVVEAGTGSGALTLALLQAVGAQGRVISVERRDDHAKIARKSIERWHGEIPSNLDLRVGDVEDVIAEIAPTRVVLDLPEPWHAVKVATEHLALGGVFLAYVPTVPQMQQTVEALRSNGRFLDITNFETLIRNWNIEGRSVRPDHQMIGHTGFITIARRVESHPGY